MLDVGCGSGDYVAAFAKVYDRVTALDYSVKMLDACRTRCEKEDLTNVKYVAGDFERGYSPDAEHAECVVAGSELVGGAFLPVLEDTYDCVLACLNPSTYHPAAFDKLLSITSKVLVYFSMDTDLNNADAEPVYCGCNSVRFAEEYLKEIGVRYTKIPYVYELEMEDRDAVKINFAYLVIEPGVSFS